MKTRGNLVAERSGVNYARTVVEGAGCLFKEINLQHDYGHDATMMLVVDGHVRPREVALQIKSGATYVTADTCRLPASAAHIHFWAEHDLATLAIVYDPAEARAYWFDLKAATRDFRQRERKLGTTFVFAKSLWNRFDPEQFTTILLPILLGEAPNVPLDTLRLWVASDDLETHDLGVRILRARYYTDANAWNCLIDAFLARSPEQLTMQIGIALAKLLGHDDLGFYSGQIPDAVRRPAVERVLGFGVPEIAKVLCLIVDHNFDRPSDGYSLLPILGAKAESMAILAAIRDDPAQSHDIRDHAAGLIEWHAQEPNWWGFWRRDSTAS